MKSHTHIKTVLRTILALPPIPPISHKVYLSDMGGDDIIQEQLFLLTAQIERITQLLISIEKKQSVSSLPHQSSFITLVKILAIALPPIHPLLPPPSNRTRKLLRARFPATGKGGAIIRRPKITKKRKNPFEKLKQNHSLFLSQTGVELPMFREILQRTWQSIEQPRPRLFNSMQQIVRNIGRSNNTNRLSTENRLLMILMILKQGLKFDTAAFLFGVSPSFVSFDFRHVVFSISVHCRHYIQWPQAWQQHPILGTSGSLDHTHFRIGRTRFDQRKYYRKDKGHAVIGQVITDRLGEIRSFFVGPRGCSNDQLVVSLSNISRIVPSGVSFAADAGFSGNRFSFLLTPDDCDDTEMKHFQKVERVVVECSIGFLKRFGILSGRFRCGIVMLPRVAHTCALLTNLFLVAHPIRTQSSITILDNMMQDIQRNAGCAAIEELTN